LCGKLKSGFGRNLDALYDVLTGGFGLISNKSNQTIYNINVSKSKLLTPKVYKLFEEANEFNKENNSINILISNN
jgi:RNAse (barnase) inhibitor barstar